MDYSLYSRYLVPIDFCAAASRARQRALQLAMHQNASVTLLHVSPAPPPWQPKSHLAAVEMLHDVMWRPWSGSGCVPTMQLQEEFLRQQALERLEQELHPEWRDAVDIRVAWRCGDVCEQILRHAAEEQFDAIILGLRRSPWPRLLPSLADRLLRHAPCEVIVVSDAPPRPPALLQWLTRWWKHAPRPLATGSDLQCT